MNTAIFETFGKYKLTERLAFGGMAEVFLATVHGEAGFVKPVVIKRLHPRLNEDAEFVQMLIDEARITAQLTHGNICQVLDLGSVNDSYYLAMEFISGEDLRTIQDTWHRSGVTLPIETAVYVITEVLAGLDFAHRKEGPDGQCLGIIHRDISPQNILISYEGEVKIIDFGIAKARLRLVQTEAGVIKGKFRYMSPEQASGTNIDHRSDVFAAGVVLYELLRGEPHSMDVADTEVLRRMRRAEFEPLRKIRPEIPPALEKLVKRALSVKPAARYPTAGDFRDALLTFLEKLGVRYGRSELARLMKQTFDIDRRRRRSGSFSGPASIAPRNPDAGTPVAAARQSDVEQLDSGQVSPVTGSGQSSRGWVAFAPTHATDPLPDTEEEQQLPPTGSLPATFTDVKRTAMPRTLTDPGLDAVPTTDLMLHQGDRTEETVLSPGRVSGALADEMETQAYYALDDDDLVESQSVPTAVDPARHPTEAPRRTSSGRFSRPAPARPAPDRLNEEHTHVLAERAPAPQGPLGSPPTLSTGFFANEAETVAPSTAQTKPRDEGTRALSERRTRIRILAVLAVGLVLALIVYLMDRPLDLEDEQDQGGPQRFNLLLPDTAPRHDAAPLAQPAADGVINVSSQPAGAAVHLCGEDTGERTPAKIRARAGRTCPLELVLEGHVRYRMRVTPERGGTTTIVAMLRRRRRTGGGGGGRGGGNARLPKGQGVLRVTSIQVGQIYVNGKKVGSTPRLDLRLMPGTYSVRVYFSQLDRYSRTRSATVQAGKTTRLHIDPSM